MSHLRGERAISSAIGVVFVVVVAVMLSTAVATFTMGIGLPDRAPQAGFAVIQEGVADVDESSTSVRFAHESGERIDTEQLEVRVGGIPVDELAGVSSSFSSDSLTGGEAVTLTQTGDYGLTGAETVSLVHVAGNESTALASHEVRGETPGFDLQVLSFEAGTAGDTEPPGPWANVLEDDIAQEGDAEIQTTHVSDGDVALQIQGEGDGTNNQGEAGRNVGVTVDLSDVAEVRYDVYTEQLDGGNGELQFMVFQDGSRQTADTFSNGSFSVDTWYHDRSVDVASISGEAKVVAHADGSQNEGVFDNVRFYDENGDRIPAREILVD